MPSTRRRPGSPTHGTATPWPRPQAAAQARPGRSWCCATRGALPQGLGQDDDRHRPLLRSGELQAQQLVPLLAAYDVTRLVSSSSTRCSRPCGRTPTRPAGSWRSRTGSARRTPPRRRSCESSTSCSTPAEGAVLCTHRPVLPAVFDALGIAGRDAGARRAARSRTTARAGSSPRNTTHGPEVKVRTRPVHVMAVSARRSVDNWAIRVHPSFTDAAGSGHLRSLRS